MESFSEMQRAELEEFLQYCKMGARKHALQILGRMGMLDRETAGGLLDEALPNCPVELFGKLLKHVPRGEYASRQSNRELLNLNWPERTSVQVVGTLATVAAAMGGAEHLRLLLDWGCDVNGASLDAATALARYHTVDSARPLFRGFPTAHQDSVACWPGHGELTGLTPLAAAVAFGNVSCVKLLLAREGVWLTETPTVSEALAMRGTLWDTPAHRECRRLVRERPDGSLRPLALWAAVCRMDAETLRGELNRCDYSREELTRTALVLATYGLSPDTDGECRPREERWEMLSVLGRRCPEALQDERVRRCLAALVYQDKDDRDEPLPEAAELALGDTVDLDGCNFHSTYYSAPLMEECLKRLGRGRRLVMSRDGISTGEQFGWGTPASTLRVLLRYVEFRAPSLPIGVSALTAAILRSGDVKLLRQALNRGLIPAEEPVGRLLELAGQNAAARALLLTARRPFLGLGPPGDGRVSYREITEEELERLLADPALRARASDALLVPHAEAIRVSTPICLDCFKTYDEAAAHTLRGEVDIVLRCALWRGDGADRPSRVSFGWNDEPGGSIIATLLCCAAAGGQTECVRALLDMGLDPEERDMGQPSALDCQDSHGLYTPLALSPLLCALLFARWDTAALLLERGARCDLSSSTVVRVFRTEGREVPYEDIRRELGAYLKGERLGGVD